MAEKRKAKSGGAKSPVAKKNAAGKTAAGKSATRKADQRKLASGKTASGKAASRKAVSGKTVAKKAARKAAVKTVPAGAARHGVHLVDREAARRWVTVEREGRIAVVRFDRGDGRNPMSYALIEELTQVGRDLADDEDLSAVVLTGAPTVFTVGFDLKDPGRLAVQDAGIAARMTAAKNGQRLCRAWASIEALTIVAVEGHCIGAGVALSVACDLIVAGEGSRFLVPEIERGMSMGWQSVPRMTNLVGPAKAKRICVLAEALDAQTALDWGLAQYLAPSGGAFARAMEVAELAASMPPIPVRMIKRGVDAYANALVHAVSHMDFDQFTLTTMSDDFHEGVNSFLEKRPPRYTGR